MTTDWQQSVTIWRIRQATVRLVSPEIIFVIVLLVGVFVVDIGRRWWRENEWKRRWRRNRDDD